MSSKMVSIMINSKLSNTTNTDGCKNNYNSNKDL